MSVSCEHYFGTFVVGKINGEHSDQLHQLNDKLVNDFQERLFICPSDGHFKWSESEKSLIFFPNRNYGNLVDLKGDFKFIPICPEAIEKDIQVFKEFFKPELEFLEGFCENVQVTFGVVKYYW